MNDVIPYADIKYDQDLFDAEKALPRLYEACRGRDVEDGDPDYDRLTVLEDFIRTTAPAALSGAAVKLRRLLDAANGIDAGLGIGDTMSLVQVLALVHIITGPPPYPTRPTSTGEEADEA